jgi:hypothetical protein
VGGGGGKRATTVSLAGAQHDEPQRSAAEGMVNGHAQHLPVHGSTQTAAGVVMRGGGGEEVGKVVGGRWPAAKTVNPAASIPV